MKVIYALGAMLFVATGAAASEPFKAHTSNLTTSGRTASVMFEIENVSAADAKMVEAECVFRAANGDALGRDRTTIRHIGVGASAVEKFSVYNAPNANSVDCYISGFYRVD